MTIDSEMEDCAAPSTSKGKGSLLLAAALGMMACSPMADHQSYTQDPINQILSQGGQMSPRNSQKHLDLDMQNRFVSMNLLSREGSFDVTTEDKRSTARLMKNLQQGFSTPLNGLISNLVDRSEAYSKANNFFWMSPSVSTLRLLKPVRVQM